MLQLLHSGHKENLHYSTGAHAFHKDFAYVINFNSADTDAAPFGSFAAEQKDILVCSHI